MMAAQDTGVTRYTMFKVNEGRVAIPTWVKDPVAYAIEHGAVTVFKGTTWKDAVPVWNIKTGVLV